MAYVVDMVIMGKRVQDVEEVFTSLVEQTHKMPLEINEKRQNLCERLTVKMNMQNLVHIILNSERQYIS